MGESSFLAVVELKRGLSLIALLGLVSFAWISVLDHRCQKECLCALLCRRSCLQACVAWGQNVNGSCVYSRLFSFC